MKGFVRRIGLSVRLILAVNAVQAGEGLIRQVYIESIGCIAQDDLGHKAGNFEAR